MLPNISCQNCRRLQYHFYAANEDVLDLMRKDPNIVDKASDALARELRAALERNLNSITEENISKVTTWVS